MSASEKGPPDPQFDSEMEITLSEEENLLSSESESAVFKRGGRVSRSPTGSSKPVPQTTVLQQVDASASDDIKECAIVNKNVQNEFVDSAEMKFRGRAGSNPELFRFSRSQRRAHQRDLLYGRVQRLENSQDFLKQNLNHGKSTGDQGAGTSSKSSVREPMHRDVNSKSGSLGQGASKFSGTQVMDSLGQGAIFVSVKHGKHHNLSSSDKSDQIKMIKKSGLGQGAKSCTNQNRNSSVSDRLGQHKNNKTPATDVSIKRKYVPGSTPEEIKNVSKLAKTDGSSSFSYSAITQDCSFRAAVIPSDFNPEITAEQSKILTVKLSELVAAFVDEEDSHCLRFPGGYGMVRNVFVVNCGDEKTRKWLDKAVSNMPSLWADVKLCVVDFDKIPKPVKVSVSISGPNDIQTETILTRLRRQNPGLSTAKWRVYKRKEHDWGVYLLLAIDKESQRFLAANDYRLCYVLYQVVFHLYDEMSERKRRNVGDGTASTTTAKTVPAANDVIEDNGNEEQEVPTKVSITSSSVSSLQNIMSMDHKDESSLALRPASIKSPNYEGTACEGGHQ